MTRSRILYLDCFSGISGDMLLGALLDLGLPLSELRAALGSLAVDGLEVDARRVLRAGISATKFVVGPSEHEHAPEHQRASRTQSPDHAHHDHGHAHQHAHEPHGHAHGSHAHRSLAEIRTLIDRSGLSEAGRGRAHAGTRVTALVRTSGTSGAVTQPATLGDRQARGRSQR